MRLMTSMIDADSDQHECQHVDGGHARVYRDGELLLEDDSPFFLSEVPPEPATYRIEFEASLDASGNALEHTIIRVYGLASIP
jgi:hypothetical protein